MLDVLYDIPTWLLGILIVGLSALLPMLGLVLVHRLVPLDVRRTQNDIAGYISNIAAFVYAVLLAFLAVAVWQDYGSAQATVQLEANAASDVFRQAEAYPEPLRRRTRDAIRTYVEMVARDEWKLMAKGRLSEAAWLTLENTHREILQFEPRTAREQLVHRQQLVDMSRLLDQRRNRLYAAGSGLNAVAWSVILIGSVLIIGYSYFMGTGNFRAHVGMTGLLGGSIGLVFFLIVAMDYPFRGDIGIKPEAFLQIRENIRRVGGE
jgi:hypothetical protein